MSYSPAQIVRQLLIDEALGTDPEDNGSWPIYVGAEPDSPDNCITIYDTEGVKDGRLMALGTLILHPGIQIRVRARDYQAGYTKGNAIQSALQGITRQAVYLDSASRYYVSNLSQSSPILPLGQEEGTKGTKRRWIFVANYLATLTEEELVLTGSVVTAAHATNATLTAEQMAGYFHTNRGAGSSTVRVTLPTPADGLHGWFVQVDAGQFEIAPPAGVHLEWSGGDLADGEALILNQPISAIYLFTDGGEGATRWIVLIEKGNVQEETP